MIRLTSRLGALALVLPFVLALAACDSTDDDATFVAADYVGTYNGASTVRFDGPDGPVEQSTALAVQVVAPAGGNTVTITMTPEGGDPIVFAGTHDANGAVFPVPGSTLVMRVDADGDVSGSGTLPFFDVVLRATTSGRITPARLLITADVEVTEGTPDTPAGTGGEITFEALRVAGGS